MSTNENDIAFNHKSDFSNPNAQRIRSKRKLLGSGQKVNNFELRFAGGKGKASLHSSPDITYMGINIDDPENTNKYFHFIFGNNRIRWLQGRCTSALAQIFL